MGDVPSFTLVKYGGESHSLIKPREGIDGVEF